MTISKKARRKDPIGAVDSRLKVLGFTRIKAVRKAKLSMDARGRTKSGKSRLMLTMPEPIGILNFDRSLETLLSEEGFKNKDVVVKDLTKFIRPGEKLTRSEAQKAEAEFAEAYRALLSHPKIKSVGVDKGTTLWEIMRFAEFGQASAKAHHYVPVNLRMRGYLMMPEDHNKNVIFLHDLKEEWAGEKPTGRWVADGFKYASSLVQENVDLYRDDDGDFVLKLQGSALDGTAVGTEWYGEDIDFVKIAAQITDTLPSEWRK